MMLMNLRGHWTTFVVDLQDELGEDFAMMAGMGFFVQSGPALRMTIPTGHAQGRNPHVRKNRRSRVCPSSRTTHSLYVLGRGKILQKQLELFHGSRDEQPHRLQ